MTRKAPLPGNKTGLGRTTPLANKAPLTRTTPLSNKTVLARTTPLSNKAALARTTPLVTKIRLGRTAPLAPKPKQARATRAKSAGRGPVRDARFLDFVRTKACDFCGTQSRVEAHHFGKHGMAIKCSDHEAVPLCHDHHVEGWHRHGTLPGKTREDWLERWRLRALALLAEFRAESLER